MRTGKTRGVTLVSVGGGILLAALAVYLPVGYTVDATGVLRAGSRWSLRESRPGSFESTAHDYLHDRLLLYRLHRYEGSAVLDVVAAGRVRVETGDLVALFKIPALRLHLAERVTALAEARERLAVLRAGAKPERVEQARVSVRLAKAELEADRLTLMRQTDLYRQGLLAQEEWEAAKATHRVRELAVERSRAELSVATSGAGPEEIAASEEVVHRAESEVVALESALAGCEIRSPIDGWFRLGGSDGDILGVSAVDTMAVEMLIDQRLAARPSVGQRFTARLPGIRGPPRGGVIVRVDRRAVHDPQGSFVRVWGRLANPDDKLEEGMYGRFRLECGTVSLLERIRREARRLLESPA